MSVTDAFKRRRDRGFTLIEVLCVVLIVGVLAGIAITKFGNSKRRAYIATMQADLRNLASTAEAYFTAENTYTGMVTPHGSEGVTLTFNGAGSTWSATAVHLNVPGVVCSLNNDPAQAANIVCQ